MKWQLDQNLKKIQNIDNYLIKNRIKIFYKLEKSKVRWVSMKKKGVQWIPRYKVR